MCYGPGNLIISPAAQPGRCDIRCPYLTRYTFSCTKWKTGTYPFSSWYWRKREFCEITFTVAIDTNSDVVGQVFPTFNDSFGSILTPSGRSGRFCAFIVATGK